MFKQFRERAEQITEHLQDNAGKDPGQDREYSGYLKAAKDLLLVSLDDIKEA